MGLEDVSIGIEATGADTTADAVNKVTQSLKDLNNAPTSNISAFATNIDNIKNAATGVSAPLTTATTGVQSLGSAYDETATKSKSLESSFTDLGGATGTAATNFKTFASSMVGAVGSIAGISAGIIGIVESYTQMERAQTSADRASNRYQQGLILLQTDQQKVNDLVAKGAQGTPEYAKAVETLALQQDKNRANLDFMTEAQQRASEAMASFATQIVPNVISVVSNVATAIITVPKAVDTMKSAFSGLSGSFSGLKSGISDFVSGITGVSPAADGASTSVKAMSLAMAAIPFAVGAAAATAFIVGIQQIYAHTADVHSFFTQLGTDIDTVVPHTKQSFVEMGNAVTQTAEFFKIGLDRMSNELKLTNINQDITKEKMSELLTQVKETGSTTVAKFDEETKAIVASYAAQGKSIDQAIADYKKNEDATAQAVANLKQYQEASKATGDSLEKDLTSKITGLTAALTGVVPGLEEFGSTGTTIRTVFNELGTEMETFGAIPIKITSDYVKFGTDVSASLEKLKPAFKDLGTDAGQILKQALDDAKAAMNGDAEAATRLTTDLKLVNGIVHDNSDAVKQADGAIKLHRDTLIDIAAKYVGFTEAAKLTTPQLEAVAKGVDDGTKALQDSILAYQTQQGVQEKTNKLANEAAQGYEAVYKKELDLKDATATLTGGLQAQYELMKSGQSQMDAFNQGLTDQYQLFLNQVKAIDNTLGKQQEYFREIQDGSGVLKIQDDEMVALNEAYIKAGETLIKQNTALSNSQDLWKRYNTDVLAGKSAVADFEIKLQDSKVAEDTQLTGLEGIAANIQGWPTWMSPTIASIKEFITANYNGAQAVIDFNLKASKAWSDLTSAGDTFFSGIIKAMGETGKTSSDDFTKAFKDLPAQVQKLLTPSDQASLAAEAAFASAGDAAGQAFAIKTEAAIGEGFTPQQALQIGAQSAASIIQGFVQQHPQFAAQAQQFFSVLSSGSAEQIKAALDQMAKMPGPLGEIARNAQTALKPMFSELGPSAATSVKTSTDALTGLGLSVNAVSGQVTTATGQIVGSINTVSGAFTPVTTALDQSAASVKQLGLNINTTSGQVTTASGEIVGQVDPVTGAFTAANTSAQNFAATIKGFGDISSAAQIVFQGIVTNANTMATNLGTSFHQMSGFAVKGFGDISSTAQITFQGIVTGANTLATNLGTAFHQASGFVASHFGEMSFTAQTTFNSMVTQANSIPAKIGDAFKPLPAALAQTWGTISQNAQTTFNNMVRQAQIAAQQIAAAFRAATAPTTQGAYSPYQGVYGAQTGQAGYYTPYQGVFAQHGFVGVVDKPTSFVVGEAGPEYVSVIPGGSAGTIGNSMITGLSDMVIFLSRTNTAMSSNSSASNKNTLALDNASTAADKSKTSLDNVTLAGNNNLISTNNNTVATDNATKALNLTINAVTNTTAALSPISPAASNTILGLIGTSGAANGTTGSLNGLTSAADSLASKINQIIQTPGGIGGGATGGGVGGGVQGPAGAFAGLASQIGPGGGGAVPAVFAPYAQYGNFSGQSPAAAPGAAYYGGPPTGGGGGGGAGAFGAYAQYGNFGGGSPAAAPGAAYYGGPPTQQGVGQGAFGAYAQYGNFGGGGSAGGAQAPSGGGQQAAPQKAQGGVMGPQGGASSPQQQPSGGASYYGGPPAGYQSSPYGAFGGYSQFGKFAASGFEGIVTQATRFVAGEAGPEHVKVTPLSNVGSSSNDVNSIMAMIAELVRQIAGQSMNINLNSYLDGYQVYKNQQKYTNGRLGNYLG